MDKVSLNGVEIFPFDSEQQLLHYVDTHKGMLIAINAEKILHATAQTRVIINRNIGYCDGAGADGGNSAATSGNIPRVRRQF